MSRLSLFVLPVLAGFCQGSAIRQNNAVHTTAPARTEHLVQRQTFGASSFGSASSILSSEIVASSSAASSSAVPWSASQGASSSAAVSGVPVSSSAVAASSSSPTPSSSLPVSSFPVASSSSAMASSTSAPFSSSAGPASSSDVPVSSSLAASSSVTPSSSSAVSVTSSATPASSSTPASAQLDVPLCLSNNEDGFYNAFLVLIPNWQSSYDFSVANGDFRGSLDGNHACNSFSHYSSASIGQYNTTFVAGFWTSDFCTDWQMTNVIQRTNGLSSRIPCHSFKDAEDGGPDLSNTLVDLMETAEDGEDVEFKRSVTPEQSRAAAERWIDRMMDALLEKHAKLELQQHYSRQRAYVANSPHAYWV